MALTQSSNGYTEFDIVEIARRCGITILKPLRDGQWLARCPFCGDSTKSAKHGHLYLKPSKGEYKCQRCGRGGHTVGLYAGLRGIDTKTAYKELSKATEQLPDIVFKPSNLVRIVDTPPAPLERRHEVYSAFLGMLALSQNHKADILRRGLPEDVIARNNYKSYPADRKKAWSICDRLSRITNLSNVPGFYKNKSGNWDTVIFPEGYLIPVRNNKNLIQGLQIRICPYDEKKDASKFLWFSSKGRPGGAGASQWIHFACPPGKKISGRIWLTEGPLKADIASYFTGAPFIAVPGAAANRDVMTILRGIGVEEVILAFDADQAYNKQVKKEIDRLEGELKAAKLSVLPASWPIVTKDGKPYPKGIDDACLERVRNSLAVKEDAFIVLTRTTTTSEKVIWSTNRGQPRVVVERTESSRYEVKGDPPPSLIKRLLGLFKK